MCKIISLTNSSKIKDMKKLTRVACKLVSQSEVDGFGYAIQGEKGLYGERTTEPLKFKPSNDLILNTFPYIEPTYNRFGEVGKPIGGAMFHGRTSTNKKSLLNTHPIQKHDWSLIHNGVVSNHGREYSRITSNDTEDLVEYMANEGISGIEANLTGYYAFVAFDPLGRQHVVKDDTASLYVAQIPKLDSLIFATKESHIRDLCKEMKYKFSIPQPVMSNQHFIFENGLLTHAAAITPKGRTVYENQYASKSLGFSLDSGDDYYTDYNRPALNSVSDISETSYYGALTQDERLFLMELEQDGDDSYTFWDRKGSRLEYEAFIALDDETKLTCNVVRPDGTVCDSENYNHESLYSGAI